MELNIGIRPTITGLTDNKGGDSTGEKRFPIDVSGRSVAVLTLKLGATSSPILVRMAGMAAACLGKVAACAVAVLMGEKTTAGNDIAWQEISRLRIKTD